MKSVWLDVLADFSAASVGGTGILVSLTAIDHLLFYFRGRSLTGGFSRHLFEQVPLQLLKATQVTRILSFGLFTN